MRVGLVKIEEEKYILMVDMHHIISDGTSVTVLVKDFAALYEGRLLPRLRIQYRDFSEWQRSPVGRAALEKQETWWLETFEKDIPMLDVRDGLRKKRNVYLPTGSGHLHAPPEELRRET